MARKNGIKSLSKRAYENRYLVIAAAVILWILYASRQYNGVGNYLNSFVPIRDREVLVPMAIIGGRGDRRVNMRSRGGQGPWTNIGIAHSESQEDDTVFSLWRRDMDPRRSRYGYQIRDKESGLTIPLNNGDAMDMLDTGDTVDIVGKESLGQFTVNLNKPRELQYL